VLGVSGTLQNMRSQLEKIKREADQVLALADEGLKSIGLKEFNNLDEANSVAENFQRGPNSHQNPIPLSKAHYRKSKPVCKQRKGSPPQQVKHAFHLKPTFK